MGHDRGVTDVRTLLLLRHAKAESRDRGGDHARPLTDQGRRDAGGVGQWLAEHDLVPDLVLCSDAVRAVQTWESVAARLPRVVPVREAPCLYDASASSVVNLVAEAPDDVRTLLVVGHEPATSATAVALAGPASDGPLLAAVRAHLPTAGVAVLELDGSWSSLEAGACRLVRLHPSP